MTDIDGQRKSAKKSPSLPGFSYPLMYAVVWKFRRLFTFQDPPGI